MKKNYYEVLGVPKNASAEDIKKAYRKLAHEYHPDKHQGKTATEREGHESRFKEINEAYQILSNPQKRQHYDTFGSTGNMGGGGFSADGFDFSGFQGFDPNNFSNFSVDMGDIFGDFFGVGGNGRRQKRGRDISIDLELPLAETLKQNERRVMLRKSSPCTSCEGSGAEKGSAVKSCEACSGSGTIRENKRTFLGTIAQLKECTRCHGKGNIPEKICKTCRGAGIETRSEEMHIHIPAGIRDGEVIRMMHQGEAVANGVSGDLYVKIHVKPDAKFQRIQDHLHTLLEIPLSLALTGGVREVVTLDGKIEVTIPAGSQHKDIIRIREKGFPVREHASRRGDFLLELSIIMPKRSSKRIKEIADELAREGY